jgi:hypothetical protein
LISFDITETIGRFRLLSKVIFVLVRYQCKNRPAYGNPWFALMSCFFQASLYNLICSAC